MRKYANYVSVSVKMPIELKDRIDYLALAGGVTRNGWILKRLVRGAKFVPAAKRTK